MTRKELNKFLKSASYEELATMGENVDVQSEILLLKEEMVVSRRNLTIFHLLMPFYISWLSNRGFEVVKELFRKWFGFQPVVHKPFDFSGFVLIAVVSGLVYFLLVFLRKDNFAMGMNSKYWKNAKFYFSKLAKKADAASLVSMCEILWIFRGSMAVWNQNEIDETVALLLLHLDDDEARKLPEDARRWIRWRLKRGGSPEFRVAALLALSSSGDKRLAPVARGLQNATDERVRVAASEALRVVKSK